MIESIQMRFKAIFGKLISVVILPFLRLSNGPRVRVIVVADDGKILLVRNILGRQNWSLPGGGVQKNENFSAAVVRELAEETGINIIEDTLNFLGEKDCNESQKIFKTQVFKCKLSQKSTQIKLKKNFELLEYRWFEEGSLPDGLDSLMRDIDGK